MNSLITILGTTEAYTEITHWRETYEQLRYKSELPNGFPIEDALPEALKVVLRAGGRHVIVAGGFIRDIITGATPHDVDVFASSELYLNFAAKSYAGIVGQKPKVLTNSVTFSNPTVQFVNRAYYPTPLCTIESFDFTINQAAFYYDVFEERFVAISTPEFWEDILAQRARYTSPERDEDTGANVLRMIKFVERGYQIDKEDVAKVVGRMHARLNGEPDQVGVEKVSKVFRRIGYAGKIEKEFDEHEEGVI